MPITILIPTFNEADNLRALLPLVQWADEILVVDSFSDDDTVAVAQQYGARVLQREYGYSASQKNWAIPQATHDWILLIDADERPTPELIAEVQTRLQQSNEEVAFWIPRENHFLNRRVRYSGWQGDKVIRFFRRDHCHYEDKHVHAEIVAAGKVGYLNHALQHFTYKNLSHFLKKMERYSDWAAADYDRKVRRVGLYHLCLKPAFRFFKHYILQRGFLDGRVGFMVSAIMAWGVFLRYAKLLEKREKSEK